ncbi:uncharacterized protein LOC107647792 isoform X1 [Arachis ipaensis]|uniref:uncharacterized protein LOC107647792 isoform X1 n=1 Tax=Arachis ipaensis TaxID=130454 RepID=UPI000A2B201E|nr:uncharacterized protein LOC107647792 isoform X1 [Arachis ipaensis]
MSRWKSLWCSLPLLHLLFQTCCNGGACRPSSCGKITNIKHPFRLKDDPASCGDSRYELSCENNRTLLYLFPGISYHVQAINYNNFTIRLVDPAISDSGDDCSTLPRYSLSVRNFSDSYSYMHIPKYSEPYGAIQERTHYVVVRMFENVIFLNCSYPIRDDPRFVDASPCVKEGGNVYAVLGDMDVGELRDECRVKMVAASSFLVPPRSLVDSFFIYQNLSYAEIHRKLSYGFHLSWMIGGACSSACGQLTSCFFNETSPNLITCRAHRCFTPITFNECGDVSKLQIIAEDFAYGFLAGKMSFRSVLFRVGRFYFPIQ